MKVHTLKTLAPWFEHVLRDEKTFEVRIDDGRGFAVGDALLLRELVPIPSAAALTGRAADEVLFTGRILVRRVKYVLEVTEDFLGGVELDDPLVVLGLAYPTDEMIGAAARELARVLAAELVEPAPAPAST